MSSNGAVVKGMKQSIWASKRSTDDEEKEIAGWGAKLLKQSLSATPDPMNPMVTTQPTFYGQGGVEQYHAMQNPYHQGFATQYPHTQQYPGAQFNYGQGLGQHSGQNPSSLDPCGQYNQNVAQQAGQNLQSFVPQNEYAQYTQIPSHQFTQYTETPLVQSAQYNQSPAQQYTQYSQSPGSESQYSQYTPNHAQQFTSSHRFSPLQYSQSHILQALGNTTAGQMHTGWNQSSPQQSGGYGNSMHVTPPSPSPVVNEPFFAQIGAYTLEVVRSSNTQCRHCQRSARIIGFCKSNVIQAVQGRPNLTVPYIRLCEKALRKKIDPENPPFNPCNECEVTSIQLQQARYIEKLTLSTFVSRNPKYKGRYYAQPRDDLEGRYQDWSAPTLSGNLQKESEAPKEAIPESTQESTLTEQLNTEIQAPKEVVEEDSKVQVKVEHSQVEAVSKERNVPSLVEQSKGEEPNIPSPLEHSETEDQQSSVESSSLLKVQPLLGQSDIKGFETQEEPATVFEDLNVPPLVEHLENEDPHSSALPSNLLEAQPLLEQPGIKVVEVQNESIIRKVQSHVVHSKIEPIQAPVSSSFFNRWGFWTFLFMILLALLAAFSGAMSSILAATPVPLHSNDHVQPPLGLNTTQCEWDYLPHVPKELMVLSLPSATEHKQPTPTATPTPTSTQSPNALPNEQPSSNVLETLRNTASKAAESPAKVAGLATVVGLVVGAVHYGPTIWAHFMK